MTIFISIQNTYNAIEIGLFHNNDTLITQAIHKYSASKELVPTLKTLLSDTEKALSDINFIAVNQGPSPFSTLRVVISSVNGLSFATGIPLIGVDGLIAMAHEYIDPRYQFTAILLNAFNQQVYAAIIENTTIVKIGCFSIQELLEELSNLIREQPIRIIGNGTSIYAPFINGTLGQRAYIPDPSPEYCTLSTIASLGFTYWQEGVRSYELVPRYLKKAF